MRRGNITDEYNSIATASTITVIPINPAVSDFLRSDPSSDGSFYVVPRLVYHIDEAAVSALTQYYRQNVPQKSLILDERVGYTPGTKKSKASMSISTPTNSLPLTNRSSSSKTSPSKKKSRVPMPLRASPNILVF